MSVGRLLRTYGTSKRTDNMGRAISSAHIPYEDFVKPGGLSYYIRCIAPSAPFLTDKAVPEYIDDAFEILYFCSIPLSTKLPV